MDRLPIFSCQAQSFPLLCTPSHPLRSALFPATIMTVLTITINNRSQETCSYGLYAEPPTISPSTPTLTRIITRVQGVANPHGQATFILSKELIATCGIYDVDYNIPTPPDPKKKPVGTGTEVIDQQSVNLGSQTLDGTLVSGTVLEIDCSHGTPCFSKVTARATAGSGAFAIRTRPDFVPQQAASSTYAGSVPNRHGRCLQFAIIFTQHLDQISSSLDIAALSVKISALTQPSSQFRTRHTK